MSGAKRIAKNLSALFSSHVVNAFQQLALTPVFLHYYGIAGYGEWLALTAAVSYLGTLDMGVQTYVNQDLTIRYHRGDMKDFHVQQSTALRLMLGVVFAAATVALVVFALPLQSWLKMDGSHGAPPLNPLSVQITVYLLALQVLSNIIFGFIQGNFMIVQKAHIGAHWGNAKALSIILAGLIAVVLRQPFPVIAAAQTSAVILTGLAMLTNLRFLAPQIFPTLRYWDGSSVPKILGNSGHFALILSCTMLLFQMPMLIMARLAGPAVVAAFSLMRIIFSMSRQVLGALTLSMGPEITQQYAQKDLKSLIRMYGISERMIFAAIPFFSVGVLASSPLLLRIWAHKEGLFSIYPYCLCSLISILMAAKEHKLQFQYSTNEHHLMARAMFGSYLTLVIVSIFLVGHFGVMGFLWAWLTVEAGQLAYTVHLNHELFRSAGKLEVTYLVRMLALSITGVGVCAYVVPRWVEHGSLLVSAAIPVLISLILAALSYPLFGVSEVLQQVKARLARRRMKPEMMPPSEALP